MQVLFGLFAIGIGQQNIKNCVEIVLLYFNSLLKS